MTHLELPDGDHHLGLGPDGTVHFDGAFLTKLGKTQTKVLAALLQKHPEPVAAEIPHAISPDSKFSCVLTAIDTVLPGRPGTAGCGVAR